MVNIVYEDINKRMLKDIAKHEMNVKHNDGLYRHIRFRDPSTMVYWFDLVTWPYVLVFNGDMGCYTFSRTADMFEFFTPSNYINPGYWGQKLLAGNHYRHFSEDLLQQRVTEYVNDYATQQELSEDEQNKLWSAVKAGVIDEAYDDSSAHAALNDFKSRDFEFTDSWEWDLTDFTPQYLWACHAIQWGIKRYYEHSFEVRT